MSVNDALVQVVRNVLIDNVMRNVNNLPKWTFGQDVLFGGLPILASAGGEYIVHVDADKGTFEHSHEADINADAHVVNMDIGFNQAVYKPCYYDDKTSINHLKARGATIYTAYGYTNDSRSDEKVSALAMYAQEMLIDKHKNAVEIDCFDCLWSGKVSHKSGYVNQMIVDKDLMALEGKNLYTAPFGVLNGFLEKIVHKGGSAPDTIVMNITDALNFMACMNDKGYLFKEGWGAAEQIFGSYGADGITPIARVAAPGGLLKIVAYAGQYKDDAGTMKPYIPQGRAILMNSAEPIGALGHAELKVPDGAYGVGVERVVPGGGLTSVYASGSPGDPNGGIWVERQDSVLPIITNKYGFGIIKNIPATYTKA